MSAPRIRILLLALLAGPLFTACGKDTGGVTPGQAGTADLAPPVYWAAREDLPHGASGLNIRAADAIQLRFEIEGADRAPPQPLPVPLRAGETVRIWWRTDRHPAKSDEGQPTELMRVDFGFTELSGMWAGASVLKGDIPVDVQVWEILAPAAPETLEIGDALELVVMAGATLPEGQLRLRARPAGVAVLPAPGAGSTPQPSVMRIRVRAEPLGRTNR